MENLLTRLFKRGKMKAATVALATALTVTPVMTGCDALFNDNGSNNNGPVIENPNSPQGSETFQAVTSDPYYTNLLNNYYLRGNVVPLLYALPVGYMEENGFDMSKLQDSKLIFDSIAYIKNDDHNTLYVYTDIYDYTSMPDAFNTCYTLAYRLTDQEYEEFTSLNRGGYIQANFFVQELSRSKTPVEANCVKMTTDLYSTFTSRFKNSNTYTKNIWGTDEIQIDFLDFSVEDQTVSIVVRDLPEGKSHTWFEYNDAHIRYMDLEAAVGSRVVTTSYDNTIYNGPRGANATNFEEYKNNVTDITYYYSSDETLFQYELNDDFIQNL